MNSTVAPDTNTTPAYANHPAFILIRGLPGSGKSYLAAALRDAFGPEQVVILDPDATDYTSQAYLDHSEVLAAQGVEAKFYPYRFLRTQAHKAIEAKKIIIWNQAFTDLGGFTRTITNLQEYALEHHTKLPVLVVEVSISPEVAKARVANRAAQGGHDVDADTFARFINTYTSFAGEGHNTIAVNGEDDVTRSVARITTALRTLL
jgi:predicted ABC-type ATPase